MVSILDISESFGWNFSDYDYNFTYPDYMEYDWRPDCDQDLSMAFDAIFIPVLYTVAVVVGLLGNGLVLVVLWQKRRSWSVTDTFVFHLCVADMLLLLTMPLWAVEAVMGWIFGTTLCKLTGPTGYLYLSVVHGVRMFSRRRPWVIQISCMVLWFSSLLLCIPDWIFLEASSDSRRDKIECVHWYPSHNWRLAMRSLYHVMMLYFYTSIFLRLRRGSQRGAAKSEDMRLILLLVVVFFICWAPYNIALMVDTVTHNVSSNSSCYTSTALNIALTTTSTRGYLHCCINPLLYAFVWGKFRDSMLDMVRRAGLKKQSSAGLFSSTRTTQVSKRNTVSQLKKNQDL
uniref:C-X-C motif chemokine receptor 3 n=1 Tax=Astyanax mexicanus TaxID=7994 RepID=W5LGL2_ASTMX